MDILNQCAFRMKYCAIVCGITVLLFFSPPVLSLLRNFLTIHIPVKDPDILVVEAWASPNTFLKAAHLFSTGSVARVVVCGVAKEKNVENNRENVRYLTENGVPAEMVTVLVDTIRGLHRTLTSARLFCSWLDTSGYEQPKVQIVTLGAHARKTWVIYKRVLGKSVERGIVPVAESYGKLNSIKRYVRYWRYILKQFFGWLYACIWPV